MSDVLLEQLIRDFVSLRKRVVDLETAGVRSYGCAFLAYNSVTDTNVTGDNVEVTVDFDTEVFDVGNDFAADVFTAPATGTYWLYAQVLFAGLALTHTLIDSRLATSNRNYYYYESVAQVAYYPMVIAALCDMDVTDTARIMVNVSGGARAVDIYGAGDLHTYFGGYRVS